jgi:hypothetical protein
MLAMQQRRSNGLQEGLINLFISRVWLSLQFSLSGESEGENLRFTIIDLSIADIAQERQI